MFDRTVIDRQAAEEAVTDVVEAFFDAIDEVVSDSELAVKIKKAAQTNIMRSILQKLMKNTSIMPENADRYFDTGL